jgi:hypothetical protein
MPELEPVPDEPSEDATTISREAFAQPTEADKGLRRAASDSQLYVPDSAKVSVSTDPIPARTTEDLDELSALYPQGLSFQTSRSQHWQRPSVATVIHSRDLVRTGFGYIIPGSIWSDEEELSELPKFEWWLWANGGLSWKFSKGDTSLGGDQDHKVNESNYEETLLKIAKDFQQQYFGSVMEQGQLLAITDGDPIASVEIPPSNSNIEVVPPTSPLPSLLDGFKKGFEVLLLERNKSRPKSGPQAQNTNTDNTDKNWDARFSFESTKQESINPENIPSEKKLEVQSLQNQTPINA